MALQYTTSQATPPKWEINIGTTSMVMDCMAIYDDLVQYLLVIKLDIDME